MRVLLPHSLWEFLDRLNAYAPDSGIWLRVLAEDDANSVLPQGAKLVETKRVSYHVT